MQPTPFDRRSKALPTMKLLRILLAVLLPPLAVFLKAGAGRAFWLNLLLTFLGYVPGLVHALWFTRPHPSA